MEKRRVIIFSILTSVVFCFVLMIYFVTGISAVYPPMKEYNFSLNVDELVKKIDNIDKDDSNLNFEIKDTTGTTEKGFRYYANLYLKDNTTSYTFNLFYDQSDKEHSKLGLVGAFDNSHKFGGYQNNSKDIQKLITIFESRFIDRINDNP